MTTVRKRSQGRKTSKSATKVTKKDVFIDLLNRLESEAEKIVTRVTDLMNQSSRDLKGRVQDLIDRVNLDGFYSVASEKKDELQKEIRRIAEDIIDRAKEIEFLPIEGFNRDKFITEAKKNLTDLITKINESEFLAKAFESADKTKDHVLSLLSIPSVREIDKLSKKIKNLETKINTLSKKAA